MRAVCAWCNAELGEREPKNPEASGGGITHGICVGCKEKLLSVPKLLPACDEQETQNDVLLPPQIAELAEQIDDPEEIIQLFGSTYLDPVRAVAAFLAWSFGASLQGMADDDWLGEACDLLRILAGVIENDIR